MCYKLVGGYGCPFLESPKSIQAILLQLQSMAGDRKPLYAQIEALLGSGVEVDAKSEEGKPMLFLAVESGSLTAVEVLVAHGADLMIVDAESRGVLHWAAAHNYCGVIDFILEYATIHHIMLDSDLEDYLGNTALHVAAAAGHKESVQKLLEKGADPKKENLEHLTPVKLAQRNGHSAVVRVFVRNRFQKSLKK